MTTVVIHVMNGRVTQIDSDAAELRVITIDHDAPTRGAPAQLYQPDQFHAFAVEATEHTYLLSPYLARAAEHAVTMPWPERVPFDPYENAGAATASGETDDTINGQAAA